MPSFHELEPFGPDACLVDRNPPCRYYHTKLRALNGERDTLTDEELEFVGVSRRRDRQAPRRPTWGLSREDTDFGRGGMTVGGLRVNRRDGSLPQ